MHDAGVPSALAGACSGLSVFLEEHALTVAGNLDQLQQQQVLQYYRECSEPLLWFWGMWMARVSVISSAACAAAASTTIWPFAELALVVLRAPATPNTSARDSGIRGRDRNSVIYQMDQQLPMGAFGFYNLPDRRLNLICLVAKASTAAATLIDRCHKELEQQPWLVAAPHVVELLLLRLAFSAAQHAACQPACQQGITQQQQQLLQRSAFEQLLLALGMPASDITCDVMCDVANQMAPTPCFEAISSVAVALGLARGCNSAEASDINQGSSTAAGGSYSNGTSSSSGSTPGSREQSGCSSNTIHSSCCYRGRLDILQDPGMHFPLLCTVLETLLLEPEGTARDYAHAIDFASEVVHIGINAAATAAATNPTATGSAAGPVYPRLLTSVLQLAPAVLAVVKK